LRSIGISGTAPTSALSAPRDGSVELWGLNNGWQQHPPQQRLMGVTRWFELHAEDWWRDTGRRGQGHVEFLRSCPVPVYMAEHYPDIPHAVRFPREHLRAKYLDYFTSSVAWMLALAVDELASGDTIHLYGVDLSTSAEYRRQRACVEFWLGAASGHGINVQLPPLCPLLQGASYAIPDADGVDRRKLIHEIEQRTKQAGAERKMITQKAHELDGYQRGLQDARALLGGTDE